MAARQTCAGAGRDRQAMEYARVRIALLRQILMGAEIRDAGSDVWTQAAVDGLDEVLGEAEDCLLDAIRAGGDDFPAPPD